MKEIEQITGEKKVVLFGTIIEKKYQEDNSFFGKIHRLFTGLLFYQYFFKIKIDPRDLQFLREDEDFKNLLPVIGIRPLKDEVEELMHVIETQVSKKEYYSLQTDSFISLVIIKQIFKNGRLYLSFERISSFEEHKRKFPTIRL